MIIKPSADVPEVVEDQLPATQDPIALALALARAHRWLEEIEGPQRLTIADIAKREKVDGAMCGGICG